jgi:hypothetical protein
MGTHANVKLFEIKILKYDMFTWSNCRLSLCRDSVVVWCNVSIDTNAVVDLGEGSVLKGTVSRDFRMMFFLTN